MTDYTPFFDDLKIAKDAMGFQSFMSVLMNGSTAGLFRFESSKTSSLSAFAIVGLMTWFAFTL